MSRPGMRFVAVKSVEQQDIQAVHRIRSGLIEQRTAKANQIRGLVAEYGLIAPRQLSHLRVALPLWLDDTHNGLTDRFRRLLNGLWGDLLGLDARVKELDREIVLIVKTIRSQSGRATARGRADQRHGAGGGGERWNTVRQWPADVRGARAYAKTA